MSIRFPILTGSIEVVDVTYYEDIIRNYVNTVQELEGIIAVIQIGSFTAPGLSDIDIIVVVDEDNPPPWDKISLVLNSQDMPHKEVLMHDIFVIPQSISNFIESFFYIDKQRVLLGDAIGGLIPTDEIARYKVLIAFEYSVHRLDTLMSILKKEEVSYREVLLFVSTLRHTYRMLGDLNLIEHTTVESKVLDIERLRRESLDGNFHNLDFWAEESIQLLHLACSILGKKMYGEQNTSSIPSNWILSKKKLVLNVQDNKIVDSWKKVLKLQSRAIWPRFVEITPLSDYVYHHVQNYLNLGSQQGNYLRDKYGCEPVKFIKISKLYQTLLIRRAEKVVYHWQFIDQTGYLDASGRGYIILSKPVEIGYRAKIKFAFLKLVKFII